MKSFFLLIIVILATISSVGATEGTITSFVAGTIYLGDAKSGNEIGGATVTVTCEGITRPPVLTFDEATNKGDYIVYFYDHTCDTGKTVTVNATYDGKSATESAFMQPSGVLPLSFAIVDVFIPEFNALTASLAVIAGIMIFAVFRRK